MSEVKEFIIGEHMLELICPVCKKKFLMNEKIILCPIQVPKNKGSWINAISLPIHTDCYFVEEVK